jgi:hypothetical protein
MSTPGGPPAGTRSGAWYETIEQIGEGTYGQVLCHYARLGALS